eukprot:15436706-Alexandrium_andersonii.AAC.1
MSPRTLSDDAFGTAREKVCWATGVGGWRGRHPRSCAQETAPNVPNGLGLAGNCSRWYFGLHETAPNFPKQS